MSGDRVFSRFGRGHGIKWTDEEIIAAWLEEPSTRKIARRLGCGERTVRERLAELRKKGLLPQSTPDINREGRIAQLGASVPLNVHGAKLKELGVSLYGVAMANAEKTGFITEGLDSIRTKYTFPDEAMAAQAVAYKSKIKAYRPTGIRSAKAERIFIVGDQQIGFWAVRDPRDAQKINFQPFHDEAAIDVMMLAMSVYRPDRVVVVGDFLDYPQLSRFQQEPEFAQTMQASIQEAYELLAKIRATVGTRCRIDFIPGNHETRMQRAICNNNPALYNLTRPGEEWPIYSVPSLLRFKELRISCAAEYPSGEVWLAARRGPIAGLVVTHADTKRKDMRADAIHGHLVLPGLETRQAFYEDGPITYTRMCVSGCANYSDTSDRLRITRTMTPSGRARMGAVQSFGTVSIDRETGIRAYGLHLITAGAVQFEGKVLRSSIGGSGDGAGGKSKKKGQGDNLRARNSARARGKE